MSEIEIEGLTIVDGIEKIQECSLFKGLSFEETRMLANISILLYKTDGEVIFEENSLGEALYIVVSGKVKVFQTEGEKERLLTILKSGEMFGEMSLIEDELTSASVVSIGDTQLLKIRKGDLEQLMNSNNLLAAKVYRSFCLALSERLRKTNQKLKEREENG
jgi:CRP/FNR family transcriptional regulator/CRP/FNR family cyclic AMP-dependent transcriptional regulator